MSVFVYHLFPNWLPGGFVGVDVFFVISGFLITGILWRELETDARLDFTRFYQRRIARLFPVMLLVVSATLFAAGLIYTQQDYASSGVTAVTALLSVANLKLYLQGSYFDISHDAQPFLHFWSLSVEEQFYLFWPILLVLCHRLFRARIAIVLAVITLLSFVLCVIATSFDPEAAFYLLPTRAWELSIGGLIAISGSYWITSSSARASVSRYLAVIGLIAILAACVLFSDQTRFPGSAALLPVLGSAAVLLATRSDSYLGYGVLSATPMIFLGKISYALYLWHWPVFSLTDYALYASPEYVRVTIKIVGSFGLTLLTYNLLENPMRRTLNKRSFRFATLASFVVIVAAFVPLGLQIRTQNYLSTTEAQIARGGQVFSAEGDTFTVMLMGDSHAAMYATLLRDITREKGISFVSVAVPAGDVLPRLNGDINPLWQDSLRIVTNTKPDVVIVVSAWSHKLRHEPDRLRHAVDAIRPHTHQVLLFEETPALPERATRANIRAGEVGPFMEEEAQRTLRIAAKQTVESLSDDDVEIVPTSQRFIDEDGGVSFTGLNGRQNFHDRSHLSRNGADLLRLDIEAAIENALMSTPKKRPNAVR